MFHRILKALVEGHFLASIFKQLKKLRKKLDKLFSIPAIYILSRITPIESNKILCITFRGEYDCNAKWIAEEILSRNLPYTIVWTVGKNAKIDDMPETIVRAKRGSYDFYKHLSSARIIIDNGVGVATLLYKKKRNQTLIETWHGSLGIKKFSKDTNKNKNWCMRATIEGYMTDYCISNSTFEDDIFKNTFWGKSNILRLGHARNDVLCEVNSDRIARIKEKVYESFNLEKDARICLYAPTFRDDGDMRPYQLDYDKLRSALETRFGGKWIILTRFHHRLLKKANTVNFDNNVINASNYSDIQELLTCTEVGITDYSSWICDYMLTKRPGFLFATDMSEYEKNDREFVYPLECLPFPLAVDNSQLIDNILDFKNDVFVKRCNEFLIDKGCIDDGYSAKRIVNAIEQIVEKNKVLLRIE